VGLLPPQERLAAKALAGVADLLFRPGKGNSRMWSLPPCDWCIVCVKFVNHRWSDKALAHYPRSRVALHGGGVSGLVALVKKLVG
jgi:hypothetical protein